MWRAWMFENSGSLLLHLAQEIDQDKAIVPVIVILKLNKWNFEEIKDGMGIFKLLRGQK